MLGYSPCGVASLHGPETTMKAKSPTSIDKEHVIRAKSRVAAWFDVAEQPASVRSKLLKGIELIARELPNRSGWYEVITIRLDNSANVAVHIRTHRYCAFPLRECLAVTTIVPGWSFGWRKILKDEDVYQIISWFLHYARQYIHRSYVANMLMAVWEKHQKVLHPFGSRMISLRYGPLIPMPPAESALDTARRTATEEWGDHNQAVLPVQTNTAWAARNMLDPLLHQAAFHFLRAQNLRSEQFGLEAVVAFDCVVQTLAAFVRSRFRLPDKPTRSELCVQLGLNVEFAELAEYMYFLRNHFGAHAGGWRWWDQAELLSDEIIEDISKFAGEALSAAADVEPQVRAVDPSPAEWGSWLFDNFDMLWDAVWFDALDRWNLVERSAR
jgi:hypothetical protein